MWGIEEQRETSTLPLFYEAFLLGEQSWIGQPRIRFGLLSNTQRISAAPIEIGWYILYGVSTSTQSGHMV